MFSSLSYGFILNLPGLTSIWRESLLRLKWSKWYSWLPYPFSLKAREAHILDNGLAAKLKVTNVDLVTTRAQEALVRKREAKGVLYCASPLNLRVIFGESFEEELMLLSSEIHRVNPQSISKSHDVLKHAVCTVTDRSWRAWLLAPRHRLARRRCHALLH
jgi:hypothetical protein